MVSNLSGGKRRRSRRLSRRSKRGGVYNTGGKRKVRRGKSTRRRSTSLRGRKKSKKIKKKSKKDLNLGFPVEF